MRPRKSALRHWVSPVRCAPPRDRGLPRPDQNPSEDQIGAARSSRTVPPGARHDGWTMPITPYLRAQVFAPETTAAMGVAFQKVCRRLGLSLTRDAVTESVAKVIIALAEGGETDAENLYQRALAHFGDPD